MMCIYCLEVIEDKSPEAVEEHWIWDCIEIPDEMREKL